MTCHNLSCSYIPPAGCPRKDGCYPGVCPDFVIRRHDTKPAFKVSVEDCDGAFDLTGLVLEASMWAKGKLKKSILASDNYFALADDIGFEQVMVGDIILIDRPRSPEKMLVLGFDEVNSLIEVQRGYHGTTPQAWKRGTHLKIIKFFGATAQTEMVYQDIIQVDGTSKNELTDSLLVYEWGPNDTCLPGCYYMEFKLLKMIETVAPDPAPADVDDDDDVMGLVGDPEPYRAYGPYPVGSVFGPAGPYAMPGSAEDIAVNGIHGTDNYPVAPISLSQQERDDNETLEDQYSKTDGVTTTNPGPDVGQPNYQGNSPNSPLYPSPLNYNEGANKQNSNPAGVQSNLMANCLSPSTTPISFTPLSDVPATFGCGLGAGVEWARRFPVTGEGFLIRVEDSPTAEF